MRNLIILIGFFIVTVSISIYIYYDNPGFDTHDTIIWVYQEKEIQSRLLSIPIVLYHNIDGKGQYSVNLKALRKQFNKIKRSNIKVISLLQLISRLENPTIAKDNKEKAIVITFDDGFHSMYTKLLPLAKEFKYPITLFVYVDFITMKSRSNLTWKKLREMQSNGIDIQCHSINHPDLTQYSHKEDYDSHKKLYEEMYLSKRIMELYLDKDVSLFAFPMGYYDLRLINLAANAGYRRVFSTDFGSNIVTHDNFCLKRHHILKKYSMDHFNNIIKK